MVKPYDYRNRDGVHRMSWDEFGALSHHLAELIAPSQPDLVVGVARAGLLPAAAVAAALRLDLTPVRLSRREHDQVKHADPVWRLPLSEDVSGRRVVIVDEIVDTGRTLQLVAEAVREKGAAEIWTAALVQHSWAVPRADVVALVTDALLVFPWHAEVFSQGQWGPHPELAEAIEQQGEPRD